MLKSKNIIKKAQSWCFKTILFISVPLAASCPTTSPWSSAAKISTTGDLTSNVFSAGTSAGFMAVWVDGSNNAYYSFSSNGTTWQTSTISSAAGDIATASDVFVAGNDTGFIVTWVDGSNNGWSSFTTDNGTTWSTKLKINGSTALDINSDVYVAGGSEGFVAAMICNDGNIYVSFSTGTTPWSALTQILPSDGPPLNVNINSATTRGFVTAALNGSSCMISWVNAPQASCSAYFTSINPFVVSINPLSSTPNYPLFFYSGAFNSMVGLAQHNGSYMAAALFVNSGDGQTLFSSATNPANWATFSFGVSLANPLAGPWLAANHAGFMSSWIVGANANDPGTPMWILTTDRGFSWTPLCSILNTPSTTIGGPVGLSANDQGFVATWLDGADSNAYASFYFTPPLNPNGNQFTGLLEQKYGPLL